MKPVELFQDAFHYGKSPTKKMLKKYENEDCVIAYYDTHLTTLYAIKTKLKHIIFIYYKNVVGDGAYYNSMIKHRYEGNATRILEKYGKILDEEEWKKFTMKKTIERL